MGDMIKTLSGDTVSLLKCSQVVTSVWSAVKELVENSLDAGATNLEVKLEDYGMDKIEVRDNGHGVDADQVEKMVAPHTTSKINEFGDMDGLTSYGFRGEALSSLCSLSNLCIVTRTTSQATAHTFTFDHKCKVKNSAPSAARPGTCVTATKLFSNLPVRKNYYKDLARKKDELKKVERIVQGFAIIHTKARVSLHHKTQIFQKAAQGDLLKSVGAVLGQATVSKMEVVDEYVMEGVNIMAVLPKKASLGDLGRTNADKTFTYVNKRLVELKDVERTLKNMFSKAAKFDNEKYPVAVVNIELSGDELKKVDVNLEPNKQKVGLGCRETILRGLEIMMSKLYGIKMQEEQEEAHNDTYGAQLDQEEIPQVEGRDFGKALREAKVKVPQKEQGETVNNENGFTVVGQVKTLCDTVQSESSIELSSENEHYESELTKGELLQSDKVFNDFKLETETKTRLPQKEVKSLSEVQSSSSIDFSPDIASTFTNNFRNNVPDIENGNLIENGNDKKGFADEFIGPDLNNKTLSDIADSFEETNGVPSSMSMFDICDDDVDISNVENEVVSEEYVEYKKTLFNTPGLDAVYLNRLKEGEDDNVPDEEDGLQYEDNQRTKKRPKNPFIDDECGVGNDKDDESDNELIEDEDAFAQGRLVTCGGVPLQPVGLLKPKRSFALLPPLKDVLPRSSSSPQTKSNESPLSRIKSKPAPVKRKYDADESVTKIDEFLERRAKIKKGPVGDQTLNNLANPLGTPRIAVNKHKIARKAVNIKIDISLCRQILLDPEEVNPDPDGLIGPVNFEECQGWLFSEGGEIKALNQLRMQEVVLYDQLAGGHVMISTRLAESVVLYPGGRLDSGLAKLVVGLQSRGCPTRITDKRLVLNGFDVVVYRTAEQGTGGDVKIKLEGLCSVIKFYGVSDLIEVLQVIHKNPDVSVKESRPSRVKEFLNNESLRMVRQLPARADQEDVVGLLTYRHRHNVSTCIHGKSMVSAISSLSGLRSSSPDSDPFNPDGGGTFHKN